MPSDSRESVFNPHKSSHGLAGAELTKLPLNALTSNQKSNCNARLIDRRPFVIMGNTMPPRDPEEDEEDEEEEDEEDEEDEEERADEPPVVREPDED